jgi:hypothetical protein
MRAPRHARVLALIGFAVTLMAGLVVAPMGPTPALSTTIFVLLGLLMTAAWLARHGRFTWLPAAVASALFAAMLAQMLQWTLLRGRVRTIFIVGLAVFSTLYALVALVIGVHDSKRGGGQERPQKPPAASPGSLT